jgi:hypothetical protein
MSYRGRAQVGIRDDQMLDFFIDNANAKLVIADADAQPGLLAARGDASVLTIKPLSGPERSAGLFTVDWLGRRGAHAHLADIATLQGLTITSPQCGSLVRKLDRAPAGSKLDLSRDFNVALAPAPELETGAGVDFTKPESAAYLAGLGWLPPAGWGSWAIGSDAVLGFRLPDKLCRAGAKLRMQVDPYLPPARPDLDTQVWVNGKLATTWHFAAHGGFSTGTEGTSDLHDILDVEAPIEPGKNCKATVDLRFTRPGASPPPYPKAEDPRPLQLVVRGMQVVPADEVR